MMDILPRFISGIDYDADNADEQEKVMINTFKENYTGDSIFSEELSIRPCNGYPEYILEIFLANMIDEDVDTTLGRLVAGWNHETFKLELRPACKTWRLFSALHSPGISPGYTLSPSQDWSDAYMNVNIRAVQGVVIKLLRLIVRELNSKDGKGTSIRCLDLSEFLYYVSSTSDLLNLINDECRSKVCSKCDKPHAPEKPRGEDCCCESCSRLTVKMNLCILDPVTILRSALTAVRESFVDLLVTGWAIGFVRDHVRKEECLSILKEFGPDNVLTYCFTDYKMVYGLLTEFQNLKQLDLTNCCIKIPDEDLTDKKRAKFLSFLSGASKDMHHLESLYLDKRPLTDNLESLLGGVGSDSLQHLVLRFCFPSKVDLTFLGRSVFAESLRNLDISFQDLDTEGLEALFEGCTNLAVLEMEYCWLEPEDTDIDDLFRLLTSLQNLKFLNIANFRNIDSDVVLSKVNYIGQMPNLKCICVRYHHSEMGKQEYYSEQVEFEEQLKGALEETGIDNTPSISIIFTYVDIDYLYFADGWCLRSVSQGESSDED